MSSGFCVECGRSVAEGGLRCERCGEAGAAAGPPLASQALAGDEFAAAPTDATRRVARFPLIPALIVLGVVSVLGAILVPNFMRARARGQSSACKSNLKNIGTALEMYATANNGAFPGTLAALTPQYLVQIPTCTSTRGDSYSGGYACFNARQAHAYTVVCAGDNHASSGYPENFPQYTSARGLLAR